ncbi:MULTISPECIES: hypothetical protein [Streptomyces]|uniref:Uncharacterized protein n=1 Tax=Streptomyces spororaveus TaxID=284039 RepID=A0ABQ3THL6_9ACTN|nr:MULTISPECIES: hypothetical protein [Streptomyces]MCM9080179.1 hypothetical protein [Streptomyces spororaveus]MCX5305416.1 hypothetical protein [Streptomyces sp. NBC_00160]GHI79502.1 hypothetical protein Sspor_50630 [Streptomyces spororaveus]
MSNSDAAAILTTPDLGEALRAVRTLLDIADTVNSEVDFEAVIRSPEVLARLLGLLPGLKWSSSPGGAHGSSDAGDDPARCLPIRVFDWCHPLDLAEPFIAALGSDPAAVRFDLDAWPEVPAAGLERVSQKYAYLTLSVNSRDLFQDELFGDHTVHVHVKNAAWPAHTARIHWLAEQVGGAFTGRVESALL